MGFYELLLSETRTIEERRLDIAERILPIDLQIDASEEVDRHHEFLHSLTNEEFERYQNVDEPVDELEDMPKQRFLGEIENGLWVMECKALGNFEGFRLRGLIEIGKLALSKTEFTLPKIKVINIFVETNNDELSVSKTIMTDADKPARRQQIDWQDFLVAGTFITKLPQVSAAYVDLLAISNDEELKYALLEPGGLD
jgi:hypothetical protein